ncbi:MAG: hypothetical protein B6D79_15215, partial [gamma proteobacterium symbiont of Ctena orbiculata]
QGFRQVKVAEAGGEEFGVGHRGFLVRAKMGGHRQSRAEQYNVSPCDYNSLLQFAGLNSVNDEG